MNDFIAKAVAVGLILLFFGSCAHPQSVWSSTGQQDQLVGDGIATYQAYELEVGKDEKGLKAEFFGAGAERLKGGVKELARSPSAAGRRLALALAATLRKQGIDITVDGTGGSHAITYAELARIDAITDAMVYGPEKVEAESPRIAEATMREVQVTIARESPSDYGAVRAVMAFFDSPKDLLPISTDQQAADLFRWAREAHAGLFARYEDPKRRLNVTSVALFEAAKQAGSEWFALYAGWLGEKANVFLVTVRQLRAAAERARMVDRSEWAQKVLDEFVANYGKSYEECMGKQIEEALARGKRERAASGTGG